MHTGTLWERERELTALITLIDAIARGAGSTIVVEAQPGLGKTALLAAGAEQAAGRLQVLSFCCGELERQLAWSGVLGLVGPTLSALSGAERRSLFAGGPAAITALFEPESSVASSAEAEVYGVLHGLQQLIAYLAERRPLLLVLDDAHWADRGTLLLLRYLQRRLEPLPVGLLIATRPPGAIVEPQRALLADLLGDRGTKVLRPRALGPGAVAEVVRTHGFATADAQFCATCGEVTAGNPFFLHELMLELADRGVEVTQAGGVGELA